MWNLSRRRRILLERARRRKRAPQVDGKDALRRRAKRLRSFEGRRENRAMDSFAGGKEALAVGVELQGDRGMFLCTWQRDMGDYREYE